MSLNLVIVRLDPGCFVALFQGFFHARPLNLSLEVLFMSPTKPQGCWNIRFSHDPIIVGGIKSVILTKNGAKFSKVMLLGQGLFCTNVYGV
jgi:hypothetical protein